MMGPVTGIVVGTVDVAAVGRYLRAFGFVAIPDVPGAWTVDGRGPTVHVVQVSGPADGGRRGVASGPRAIDLYVRSLDEAIDATVLRLGDSVAISPVGEISLGPVRMCQAMCTGPDGLQIVLVESTHRRPSLLDEQPERLISEPYSVVWAVPDRDLEAAAWVAGGATKGIDLAFADASLAAYLGLPAADTVVHMATLSDAAVSCGRLELMSFPQHADSDAVAVGAPSTTGIVALQFDEPPTVAVDADGRTAGGIAVVGPRR
jgi:hypothetical protein